MFTSPGTTLSRPRLYYAVFDAATRLASTMARAPVPMGTRVLCAADSDAAGSAGDERAARTIAQGRFETSRRWSGVQPGGGQEPGAGGLYVSLESEATLREALQHGRGEWLVRRVHSGTVVARREPAEPVDEATATRRYFVFELTRTLIAVDLCEGARTPLCQALERQPDVRHALDEARLESLSEAMAEMPEDSSVSRALGNAALLRSGADALIVPPGRGDYTSLLGATLPRGRCAVLAGNEGTPLSFLKPLVLILCEDRGGGALACSLAGDAR
jgi:hypothetical protein